MRVGMRQTYAKGPEDVAREVVDTVADIPSSSRDGVRRQASGSLFVFAEMGRSGTRPPRPIRVNAQE